MLDRRQFLSAATIGAAFTLAGRVSIDGDSPVDTHDLAHPELLLALGPATVREIGETYCALVPAESNRAALETALRAELHASRVSSEDPVRADFAAGRVIVVRDWVLSRTEARQCALYSMCSERRVVLQ